MSIVRTLFFSVFFLSLGVEAKINVVTTTTNLKALVKEIGGGQVNVHSLCKGSQDPHFLEAKPSYMVKASKADLLVQVGLGLEGGWLPLIIRGARNPDLRPGELGHLFASQGIDLLEKVEGSVSRSEGDVHPEGNPHFMLDPFRAAIVGKNVAKRLAKLSPEHKDIFEKNAMRFEEKMKKLIKAGESLLEGKNRKLITFHKTLNYFNKRFGLENLAYLEPKPGVPPTAAHIIKVIKLAKSKNPKHILIENYFDPTVGRRVIKDVPESELHIIPVAVEGAQGVSSLEELYRKLLLIVSDEDKWIP